MSSQWSDVQQMDAADGRRAARHSMPMLRSAKLVCQSGEYFCIIRDVSEQGVGLRFCHTVPPEERVILQLENGDTYPVERIWSGKRQSGYRFASPINLPEFIHEPSPYQHRSVRLAVAAPMQLTAGNVAFIAQLADLSCTGAKIETDRKFESNERVRLELPSLTPRIADICWQQGPMCGLSFHNCLTIEELAQAALTLQPFGQIRLDEPRQPAARRRDAA